MKAMTAEEKKLAGMPLDELIRNYLEDVKRPKARSLDMEASLRDPEMLQCIGRFSQAFYTATKLPKGKTTAAKGLGDVNEALNHLIETVADFVTPGDLYKCDNLSSIGKITP
jgi:hypothetical protein